MAAPQIPNLLSLRGSTARGRGRGRGRGGVPPPDVDPKVEQARRDLIVQQTDTDANVSRLSAVDVGYLDDPFAKEFKPSEGYSRRFPIINRGTYSRTKAIDKLVNEFLSSSLDERKQIISLGAGSDTRFFRLMSSSSPPNVIYHELDFPTNATRKLARINHSPILKKLAGEPLTQSTKENELHTPSYHLHAVDLRTLDPSHSSPTASTTLSHIEPNLPTLLLSECCLTYLTPTSADAIVHYFSNTALSPTTPLGLALYEPINPSDAFGKVMVSNLAARGIALQTLHKYDSLAAQVERMRQYGLADGQGAVDVEFLNEHWIDEEEKSRIATVEMLDEVEELNMLARHYCVAWGWRDGKGDDGGGRVWDGWRRVRSQLKSKEYI